MQSRPLKHKEQDEEHDGDADTINDQEGDDGGQKVVPPVVVANVNGLVWHEAVLSIHSLHSKTENRQTLHSKKETSVSARVKYATPSSVK